MNAGMGASFITVKNSSFVTVMASFLWVVSAMKYILPGSTSRTELTNADTLLMLSMMISLSSQKMMLLYFPMISTISFFRQRSPISFKCSISMVTIRSSPGWVMSTILPFCKCLRRSMQKLGAVMGLGLFCADT